MHSDMDHTVCLPLLPAAEHHRPLADTHIYSLDPENLDFFIENWDSGVCLETPSVQ